MAATLKDVATKAGVSVSTVSQVLRNKENTWISENTKQRVRRIARKLGYRPNPAARLLASRQGHYFAIVVRRTKSLILLDPVRTVANRVLKAGYIPFIVESLDLPLQLSGNIEILADGVVFIGTGGKEFLSRIDRLTSGAAAVAASRPLGTRFPEFVWDETEGFERILDHLAELGHRQIALLGGNSQAGEGNQRRRVQFQQVCEARGLHGSTISCESEQNRIQAGRRMTSCLLETHPNTTAVVGRNNEFTVGALAELQAQGIQVPEDLSLISYTDSQISEGVWPTLTALRTPVREAADRAAQTALAILAGKTVPREPTYLPVELILRQSTAPPHT